MMYDITNGNGQTCLLFCEKKKLGYLASSKEDFPDRTDGLFETINLAQNDSH